MDMSGSHRIPAKREVVYAALNDPEVLQASLPGCEEVIRVSDIELTAKITAKVGPVKARFNGDVFLSDLNPPESYTITGEGKGGAAGFAKGGAKVRLEEDGDETVLTYEVHANVGGKLAQLGSRLIDSTAKKMAEEFFRNFSERAAQYGEAPAEAAPPTEAAVEAVPQDGAPAPAAVAEPAPVAGAAVEPPAPAEDAPAPAPTAAETAAPAAPAEPSPAPTTPEEPEPERRPSVPMVAWIVGAVALVLILVLLFS